MFYATRCVIWTVSQSLSEEAADLTAATVVSVASPTASFTASVPSSWYRTRDLHYQYANKLVVFNCTKPIVLRIL